MSPIPVRVLLTCGGGGGTPANLEGLARSKKYDARIVAADSNPASGNLFLPEVDARYQVPECHLPEFIPAILSLIKREGIEYLYSGLDEEIVVLARHRTELEAAGCRMLIPDESALVTALDKQAFNKVMEGRIRVPRGVPLSENFDAKSFFAACDGKVIVKQASGHGGRMMDIPETLQEFEYLLERARRYSERTGMGFLVQHFVEGVEWGVSTLHDGDRNLVYAVCRKKFDKVKIITNTVVAAIEENAEVIAQAVEAVQCARLDRGFNGIETMVSHEDGLPYLLEINGGRSAAHDMNLVAAGINMMELMIDILRGERVEPIPHPPIGIVSLRTPRYIIVNRKDVTAVPSLTSTSASPF